jgi:hypothetical protein
MAVTRYLSETDGVRAGRLMAAGVGEFRPLVDNETREHRALNRRVEIHLLSSVQPETTAALTTPTNPQPATEHTEP